LFARAAVLVDFGSLPSCPRAAEARALLAALRGAGVCPVGLAFGTDAVEQLARELDLPVLAKFRAQYERQAPAPAARPTPEPAPAGPGPAPAAEAARPPAASTGLMQGQPVRSGQQVYAQGRDLIVTATVGAGA